RRVDAPVGGIAGVGGAGVAVVAGERRARAAGPVGADLGAVAGVAVVAGGGRETREAALRRWAPGADGAGVPAAGVADVAGHAGAGVGDALHAGALPLRIAVRIDFARGAEPGLAGGARLLDAAAAVAPVGGILVAVVALLARIDDAVAAARLGAVLVAGVAVH